jgi:hypothetical protein
MIGAVGTVEDAERGSSEFAMWQVLLEARDWGSGKEVRVSEVREAIEAPPRENPHRTLTRPGASMGSTSRASTATSSQLFASRQLYQMLPA